MRLTCAQRTSIGFKMDVAGGRKRSSHFNSSKRPLTTWLWCAKWLSRTIQLPNRSCSSAIDLKKASTVSLLVFYASLVNSFPWLSAPMIVMFFPYFELFCTLIPPLACQMRRGRSQRSVSYTHLRAHETKANLVCRLLLEKKKK